MTKEQLAKTIETRVYETPKTFDSVRYLCYEATAYGFHSVQIFPNMLAVAHDILDGSEVKITALGAYPHGGMTIGQKAFEAADSAAKGADEIEMMVNTRMIKNKDKDYVVAEMKAVKAAVPSDVVVKFNIEIEYLNREEIALTCEAAKEAGIDYISMTTGLYHTMGANKNDVPLTCKVDDVAYLKQCLEGSNVKIQAVGYIDNADLAKQLHDAGAERIATEYALNVMKSCN